MLEANRHLGTLGASLTGHASSVRLKETPESQRGIPVSIHTSTKLSGTWGIISIRTIFVAFNAVYYLQRQNIDIPNISSYSHLSLLHPSHPRYLGLPILAFLGNLLGAIPHAHVYTHHSFGLSCTGHQIFQSQGRKEKKESLSPSIHHTANIDKHCSKKGVVGSKNEEKKVFFSTDAALQGIPSLDKKNETMCLVGRETPLLAGVRKWENWQ
jgi:hypothetical protein